MHWLYFLAGVLIANVIITNYYLNKSKKAHKKNMADIRTIIASYQLVK